MKKSKKKPEGKVFYFESKDTIKFNYLVLWKPDYKEYKIVACNDKSLESLKEMKWWDIRIDFFNKVKKLRNLYHFSFSKPIKTKQMFLAHCLAYNLIPCVPLDEVYPE